MQFLVYSYDLLSHIGISNDELIHFNIAIEKLLTLYKSQKGILEMMVYHIFTLIWP